MSTGAAIDGTLDRLGYAESDNYLRSDDFDRVVDYGHVFRTAAKGCNLRGVYTLREGSKTIVPVVYVCEAHSDASAKRIHRLVWNQDTVPFLIAAGSTKVRVYPGFCHAGGRVRKAVSATMQAFGTADMDQIAATLGAAAVDEGQTWSAWGRHIRAEHRVDRQLLENLRRLDGWLQNQCSLDRAMSHALIGKYVYLKYLRDRDILSDRKLQKWRIDKAGVFGRAATRDGLQALLARLDDWLNGEVFPIDFASAKAPTDQHVQRVAATFEGDEPIGSSHWQLHLDFKAYDFSYIPIEVLSVVYEQFLHDPGSESYQTGGRSAGAYYTPIPIVNLMLSELEERRPLQRGMRVFDPACGSGAFLVQALRRLIEKEFPPSGRQPTPIELRELVEEHFVGLDTDEDACRVAKLSLILTLLDYVRPRDLEVDDRPGPKPKLPRLKDNIVCGNFFDDAEDWRRLFVRRKADWIVGNPPWKQLKAPKMREEDKPVLEWMKANARERPVGNHQMARAFAWRVADYLAGDGEIALFLPAMTLFEEAAMRFRSMFLREMEVHAVANLCNLRHVISGERFTAPASAFFYRTRPPGKDRTGEESIRCYSPFLANQQVTGPSIASRNPESWCFVVNASEIRDLPLADVMNGHSLPWKLALWGSDLDRRLLRRISEAFPPLGSLERRGLLLAREGPQLRDGDPSDPPAGMVPKTDLLGRGLLDVESLEGLRDFFLIPRFAVRTNEKVLVRRQGGLPVCRGPHVIVSAARNFAIYTDDDLIVPPRQIGIVSPSNDVNMLKALAVFLSSDFAFYYEFLLSSELGIERDRSTLRALRTIPTPLTTLSAGVLRKWAGVHDGLAKATRRAFRADSLTGDDDGRAAYRHKSVVGSQAVSVLNELVNLALGINDKERALIHDLVRVRACLNDGQVGREATRPPTKPEVRAYCTRLQTELDAYIRDEITGMHGIAVLPEGRTGMVRVRIETRAPSTPVSILPAGTPEAAALEECRRHVRRIRGQWIYFDRNLRVYDGVDAYILKPMQRFQWTESQARLDARDLVVESMDRRGKE